MAAEKPTVGIDRNVVDFQRKNREEPHGKSTFPCFTPALKFS